MIRAIKMKSSVGIRVINLVTHEFVPYRISAGKVVILSSGVVTVGDKFGIEYTNLDTGEKYIANSLELLI